MKSYDDLKSILEAELSKAVANHERERHRTGEALAEAVDRFQRFALHGMIPEDITDEEGGGNTIGRVPTGRRWGYE